MTGTLYDSYLIRFSALSSDAGGLGEIRTVTSSSDTGGSARFRTQADGSTASAAVPGVGTIVAFGAIGAESLVFIEAAAFYTLAVAEVHGVDVRHDEHEELLVMTVMLGASGTAILANAVSSSGGAATGGSLAGRALRVPGLKEINRRMMTRFVRKFAVKRAGLAVGKLAPAGLGAAVGGWGNRKLGRTGVETADAAFGTPPDSWPAT